MSNTATAYFAGGCFWCTEAAFEVVTGVIDVTSGYAGGAAETANYRRVCEGNTGHAEVIRITYDRDVVSYDRLLDVFFEAHDPTQLNRQGHDVGTQYRSAVFYESEEERSLVAAKIDQLQQRGVFRQKIVTTLEPLIEFFPAEAYHQDYARAHPEQPYIQSHALPRACQIRAKYGETRSSS
jgi:methionine-S-sulfoxide reductase